MCTMLLNNELKGIELYFEVKPVKEVIQNLKANGYRWHGVKSCWYAKQNENTLEVANIYSNNEAVNEFIAPVKTSKKVELKPLFERVKFIEGNTNVSEYHYKFVGSNYTGLSTKETAKEIRTHLKKQFPEVKFSVTSDYSHIDITIKSSPYNNMKLEYSPELECRDYREFEKENNKELIAIIGYCKQLLESYNYDDSDSMTDYFHTHFYTNVSIDYDYTQTEQTEVIKANIIEFRNNLIEAEKLEEERKEKAYQEYLRQREEDQKQYEVRKQEEKQQIESIYNNINVVDIEENEQYFVIDSEFASLNKNNTLEQYVTEVSKGDYTLENVKITREVHFNNEKDLNNFSNLLLSDFTFLENTGGSHTDDKRINTMTDFYNMTEEERKTVQWCLYGVAIYYNNELKFVVDTQGYNYARYVGLVENSTIEKEYNTIQLIADEEIEILKEQADTLESLSADIIINNDMLKTWNNENWNTYKELIKNDFKKYNFKLTKGTIQQLRADMDELKISMYKLLLEVDGIQEQFKNADIKQGDKITMFYISDWGGMVTSRITVNTVESSSYAQYNNAVKITFTPEGKRKQYYNHWYSTLLVYNGWYELPKEVLHIIENKNNMVISKSKYTSCDTEQFNEILNHFMEQDINPIVNTYKPIF